METLTSSEKKRLKSMAHALKPVVQIGREGLSDPVLKEIDRQLLKKELIKIQILDAAEIERHDAAAEIAKLLQAQIVQIVGFKITVYRENPELHQEVQSA